ncbi:MAG: hypothetical protein JRG91_06085 [Deltaproteobacteria bacterium]|nr:hypothetical protein [Deltaproteobacteria bacterium]
MSHHTLTTTTCTKIALVIAAATFALACEAKKDPDTFTTPERMAFTVNAAFDFSSGSYSIIDLDTMEVLTDVLSIHSDAVGACSGGDLFILERYGADTITSVSRQMPFSLLGQHSLGSGANPQGLVKLASGSVLVTLLGRDSLVVIDPASGEEETFIDLSWAADADGFPEAGSVTMAGSRIVVALQRLDQTTTMWDPSGPGWLVVIDSSSLEVVDADTSTEELDAIVLTGMNPTSGAHPIWDGEKLYVPESGFYSQLDGGLEMVDLDTMQAEGFVVTEESLGGDITDIVLVNDHLGYATVNTLAFEALLVRFDPSDGTVEADPVLEGAGYTLVDMTLTDDGKLLVVDRTTEASGVQVIEAASGEVITRLHVGMAPSTICLP